MATLAIKPEEYEALLNWARVGALESDQEAAFLTLRKRVDAAHGIQRYTLVIRWEQLPQKPAPGILPTPQGEVIVLEQIRPPTPEDVMQALSGKQFHPSLVHVTRDPSGEVGWYDLEHFPWT
jgi:hypothetical protein